MKKWMIRKEKDTFASTERKEDAELPVTDPQGSYTGCPLDPYEIPVQDADDL